MKEQKTTKNMFELLKLIKEQKRRFVAGAGVVAVIAGGVAVYMIKNDNSTTELTEDPKDIIEIADPDYEVQQDRGIIKPKFYIDEKLKIDGIEQGDDNQKKDEQKAEIQGFATDMETEELIKKHTHEFSEWNFKDENQEMRTCSCGEVEIRDHKLLDPTYTYIAKGDGQHILVSSTFCDTCDYTSTIEKLEDCNYTVYNINGELEYKVCPRCGDSIKVTSELELPEFGQEEHTHNLGKEMVTYEDINANTHTMVITQMCTDLNCTDPLKITKKVDSHTFGSGVVKGNNIIYTCSSCGYEKVRNYSHDLKGSKPSHSHQYGNPIVSYKDMDAEGHTIIKTKTCDSCGFSESVEARVSHTFDLGVVSGDNTKIVYTCDCGYQKVEDYVFDHIHNYGEAVITYKDINADNHTKVSTKTCSSSDCEQPIIIIENVENHVYGPGVINEDNTKITYTCTGCGYENVLDYEHTHSEAPNDLVYSFDSANDNGTHKLKASYECATCGEVIDLYKNEDCDYTDSTISYEMIEPSNFAITNKHYVVTNCNICKAPKKVEEACVPDGEIKYMRYLSNIFEFYNCEICNNRCEQYVHDKHNYGDWEYDSDMYHVRECACGGSILSSNPNLTPEQEENLKYKQEQKHNMVEKDGSMTCTECGYSIPITLDHEHAKDGMSLMELIKYPFYDELLSKSQIANPNPSPDDYCSRYDLKCSTCGAVYSIHYAHDFRDGFCRRTGYCGGIADPNYVQTNNLLDDMSQEVIAEECLDIEDIENLEMDDTLSDFKETNNSELKLERKLNLNY